MNTCGSYGCGVKPLQRIIKTEKSIDFVSMLFHFKEEKKMDDVKKEVPLQYLSEEELLREFISPQAARQLICEYNNLYNIMTHLSLKQLAVAKGMGEGKVRKLACVREFMKRIQQARKAQITRITAPADVAAYFADMQDLQQEEFRVLFLDTKNQIMGQKTIFIGTVNAALVSAREIFHAGIQNMATNIILVHNHPSGDPFPSREDKQTTARLVQSGKLLHILILDHVILGKNTYYSMQEKGYMEDI
jgi:DNA repair protein RadC